MHLRKIPLVCYNAKSTKEIADYLGQVLDVGFDTLRPQSKGYFRTHILFDVSKPLRNSKEYELTHGGFAIINFE